jgi:hypothetical protein
VDSSDSGGPDGDWVAVGGAATARRFSSSPAEAGSLGRGGASAWPAASFSGGRFWALQDELDGESAISEVSDGEGGDGVSSAGSPRAAPSPTTLGDFISHAEELGGSLSSRRRAAFVPGGKGSRFGSVPSPRFHRLGESPGSSSGQRRGGGSGSAVSRRASGTAAASTSPAAAPPPPVAILGGGWEP